MRKWLLIGVVVIVGFATMAAKCAPVDVWGASIQSVLSLSKHSDVNATSIITPSIGGPSTRELCQSYPTQVPNRTDYCRVFHGIEDIDSRDWLVTITLNGGTPKLPGPVSSYDPNYGWTITTSEGTTFENCQNANVSSPNPGLVMRCDFLVTNQFFANGNPGQGLQLSYVLDKLWNWNHYELSADKNCAGAIAALWASALTAIVTYNLLSDCSDTPWNGQP
jgi:hypothetical protein